MARLHARRKGRAASKRPIIKENPSWVTLEAPEIVELIMKYSKEGTTPALIGLKLRDQHAVPNVKLACGKSVTTILEENGMKPSLPSDLGELMKKVVKLNGHILKNKADKHNRRSLELIESKIRRLSKYYKNEGIIPHDWKYSRKTVELQIA